MSSITLTLVQAKFHKYEKDEKKLLSYFEKLGEKIHDQKMKIKKNFMKTVLKDLDNFLATKNASRIRAPIPKHDASIKWYGIEMIHKLTMAGVEKEIVNEVRKRYDEIIDRWGVYKMQFECYKITEWVKEKYQ